MTLKTRFRPGSSKMAKRIETLVPVPTNLRFHEFD